VIGKRGWSRRPWRDVVEAIFAPFVLVGCLLEIIVGIPIIFVLTGGSFGR
jgi:hypothetical protein